MIVKQDPPPDIVALHKRFKLKKESEIFDECPITSDMFSEGLQFMHAFF